MAILVEPYDSLRHGSYPDRCPICEKRKIEITVHHTETDFLLFACRPCAANLRGALDDFLVGSPANTDG